MTDLTATQEILRIPPDGVYVVARTADEDTFTHDASRSERYPVIVIRLTARQAD